MKRIKVLFILSLCLTLGISCSEKYNLEEGETGIYMSFSSSATQIGKDITINVFTEDGEDITSLSSVYVDGNLLPSNTFSSDEVGIYSFKARYVNVETEVVDIEFFDPSVINFRKRALVEDYTGTWCGWCPRISYALSLVEEQSDDAVLVAIHRAPSGTQDPYTFEDADPLEQLINKPGYPKGFINRMNQWEFPEPDNISQVISYTQGANPKLGLKLSSTVEGNNITLDVDASFSKDFSDLKLVVYILEDGLVYPQVNYTSYYQDNPIPDYVHNHTLRFVLTDIIGDEIDSASTRTGSEFSRTFNFVMPDNIEDSSQVEFVAFITDADDQVVNVREAAIGETQDYEILE